MVWTRIALCLFFAYVAVVANAYQNLDFPVQRPLRYGSLLAKRSSPLMDSESAEVESYNLYPQNFFNVDNDVRLKKWATQLRFGKRSPWASQVRFG
uniref:Uncharacterized protein n=1 Tax=Panagrellus redivivus TaxID=6233 RepID=A0A7E4UUH9_PANRE